MNTRLWVVILVSILVAGGLFGSLGVAESDPETTPGNPTAVDSALSDVSGTQTVIVQLTERPEQAVRATAQQDQTKAMKAHATETQSAFERFADGNPHVEIDRQFWLTNALVVTVDTDRVPLEKLGTVDNVEQIHENHEVQADTGSTVGTSGTPAAEPYTSERMMPTPGGETILPPSSTADTNLTAATEIDYTSALEAINVPEAVNQGHTGEGVRVAVIDSGVNPDHPDIDISDENWVCFEDCAANPNGPHDVAGHGTHVSGTVVGGNANDVQLQIGVAPDATLMHAKGLGDDNRGSFSSIVSSMEWAVENNADIISMSLGSIGYNDNYIDPVRNAEASGTVVIASIGNNGAGTSGSPGNVYDSLSVGAVEITPDFPSGWIWPTTDNTVWEGSSGESIQKSQWFYTPYDWPDQYTVPDVSAPGSIIWSADADTTHVTACGASPPTSDLSCKQGTSMAAPHVSGVVALMLSSTDQDLSPDEIKTILSETAVDIGEDHTRQGAGMIDAEAAVTAAQLQSQPQPQPQPDLTITDVSTPKQVTAGKPLLVNYTVENMGDGTGTSSVTFLINGTDMATDEIGPLGPGEQHSGTYSFLNPVTDRGAIDLSVTDGKTTHERLVTVVDPTVRLTDVNIAPDTISTTTTTHTLSFKAQNISDDGKPDEFTITLPKNVSVESIDEVTATDASTPIDVEATTQTETGIKFTVSPDTRENWILTRDIDITVKFSVQEK